MQAEILAEDSASPVRILGVNAVGLEVGNDGMCQGRTLPWLQDQPDELVYDRWAPGFRDVVIVNGANEKLESYNLTDNDLADPANYAELKAKLQAAAAAGE